MFSDRGKKKYVIATLSNDIILRHRLKKCSFVSQHAKKNGSWLFISDSGVQLARQQNGYSNRRENGLLNLVR